MVPQAVVDDWGRMAWPLLWTAPAPDHILNDAEGLPGNADHADPRNNVAREPAHDFEQCCIEHYQMKNLVEREM